MKSSFTIGHLFGIPIKIHFSLLIILPFFAWAFGNNITYLVEYTDITNREISLNPYLLGSIMAVLLFASILAHELAHALMARSKGVETTDITLMLLGGLANMEDDMSDVPENEMKIAASGPGMSILIGVVFVLVANVSANFLMEDIRLVILYTGQLNIFLAIFNLLPAFPTDGGRILRAFIARKKPMRTATEIATKVGKAFAVFFGILGFMSANFLLIFIAIYLYVAATQENQFNNIKSALSDLNVGDLMTKNVKTVPVNFSVHQLIQKMFEVKHSGFPVTRDGKVVGIVTMEDAQKINQDEYRTTPVQSIMEEDIHSVRKEDALIKAFQMLFQKDIGRLIVLDENGVLEGIITRSDIMTGIRIQQLEKIKKEEE